MSEVRTVGAGRAVEWFKGGWKIFSASMANWVLMALAFGVIAIVLSFIPFLGMIVLYLLMPILLGGMLLAAQKADQGREVEIPDLFALFKDASKRTPLLILGLIMLAGAFLSMIVLGGTMMGSMSAESPMPSFGATALILGLLLAVVMGMLFLYATPLVVFKNASAVDAIKGSFDACMKNFAPFIIFMLIYMVLSIIAAIPFGLGFLVLLPVVVGAIYVGYKDLLA